MENSPENKKPKWSDEQIKTFLNHVGQYPCLWDGQATSKKQRIAAKKKIAIALCISTKVVHQKLITLAGQYHRVTKRIALDPSKSHLEWYPDAWFFNSSEIKEVHSKMCRICLVPIDDPNALEFLEFSPQFTDCTGFSVMTYVDEPAFICADCRDELLACCKFLDKVKQTESILKQNLANEDINNEQFMEKELKSSGLLETEEKIKSKEYVKLEIESLEVNDESNFMETEPKTKVTGVETNPRNVICTVCGKLVYKYFMNRHMANHNSEIIEQRCVCDICGRDYKHKEGLRRHLCNHTNDNRYQCQFCDLKFLNWGARRFHIRSKHMVEKPFHCHLCGHGFLTKKRMEDHIQGDHGNASWECDECRKTFKKKINLKTHVKTMHGEQELKACDKCGKKFKTNKYLKQHYLVHTGEKNYVCPVQHCTKAFAQNHVLRSHVEKMHPEAVEELPPPGTIVSLKAIERLKEIQIIKDKLVKTELLF